MGIEIFAYSALLFGRSIFHIQTKNFRISQKRNLDRTPNEFRDEENEVVFKALNSNVDM